MSSAWVCCREAPAKYNVTYGRIDVGSSVDQASKHQLR